MTKLEAILKYLLYKEQRISEAYILNNMVWLKYESFANYDVLQFVERTFLIHCYMTYDNKCWRDNMLHYCFDIKEMRTRDNDWNAMPLRTIHRRLTFKE